MTVTSPLAHLLSPEPSDNDRQREVINALAEVADSALNSADLSELLTLLSRRLCALLGIARCSAFVRRSDGRFHGVAGHGSEGDLTPAVERLVAGTSDDALTREAVARRAPVLATDARRSSQVYRDVHAWRARAVLAVPLVCDGEVVAMLYLDDENRAHTYTDSDIELAELFGRLAALYIRQCQLATRMARQVGELTRRRRALEHLGDLHSRLTRAVSEGADTEGIIALLSDLVGKPVMLLDPELRVRAWASPAVPRLTRPPVLPAPVLDLPMVSEAITGLDLDRPSVTIPPQRGLGLSRRHLLRVLTIGGRRVGYLDIVEMGGLLGPLDAKLAEHVGAVLSLRIVCEQRQAEAHDQARDDFLADLLRGARDPHQLTRGAPRFGLDLNRPHLLVRFTTHDATPRMPPFEHRAVLVEAAARGLGRGEPPSVSLPDAVVLLVELPGPATPSAVQHVHRGLAEVLDDVRERIGVRRAIVSRVCREAADFPAANRELQDTEELIGAFGGRGGVIAAEALGVLRLVASVGRIDDAVRFAKQCLGPLRGTADLDTTLRAYLRAGAQVRATAAALGVHENTVRYRLARISQITGIDPRDFNSLLAAQLAFQVLDLAGGSQP